MIVREFIEFKRTGNTKTSLGLGIAEITKTPELLAKYIEEEWGFYDSEARKAPWADIYLRFWTKGSEISEDTMNEISEFISSQTHFISKSYQKRRWMVNSAGDSGKYLDIKIERKLPDEIEAMGSQIKEALEFRRGQDSKEAMDVGKNSSLFWPKPWNKLKDEEKEKAIEKFTESDEYEMYAEDFVPYYLLSDEFLMEPSHDLLVQKFGPNPYEHIQGEPLIGYDPKSLEFDIEQGSIGVKDALEISDNEAFLKYLGFSEDLIPEIYYTILKDGIEFEENDSEYEFTNSDLEQIRDAQIIFRKYLNDRLQSMKDQYYWYFGEEGISEYLDEKMFDKNLNIVEDE